MRRPRIGFPLVFPLLLALAAPALAQDGAPAPSGLFFEQVNVEVVNVDVVVTDQHGAPVSGLGKDDFTLRIDGQSVPIAYFYAAAAGRTAELTSTVRPRPGRQRPPEPGATPPEQQLHVAIVVDNDHIRSVNRKRVFRELRAFLDTRLADDALVTVASLEPELVIHSDFLADRQAVEAMLGELEHTADRPRAQEMERRQILNELSTSGRVYDRATYSSGATLTPDAALVPRIRAWAESEFLRNQTTVRTLARMVDTLAGVPGRKALLYVSDGIENRPGEDLYLSWSYRFGDEGNPAAQGQRSASSNTDYEREIGRFDLLPQFQQLATLASAARVTWYAIDAESDHAGTLRSAETQGGVSSEALEAIENNTREPAELTANLTGGRRLQVSPNLDLAAIANDFGTYYSLGFTPVPDAEDRPHDVRVEVRGKDLVVRHRQSWKPKSADERAAETTQAALLYHTIDNPLEVTLTPGTPRLRDDGNRVVPVEVRIPLRNLVLLPLDGVHGARLTFFVTTRDQRGDPRPVQKIPFSANIPSEVLEQALEDSVRYQLPLVVRPGDQQLALGVRDEVAAVVSTVRLDLASAAGGP